MCEETAGRETVEPSERAKSKANEYARTQGWPTPYADAERAYHVVHAEILNLFESLADKLERDGFRGQPVPDLVRKLRETVAERRDGTTCPPG